MWIEHLQSLPLRKCGLKLELKGEDYVSKESLPLRKCGLKQQATALQAANIRHFPCGSVD